MNDNPSVRRDSSGRYIKGNRPKSGGRTRKALPDEHRSAFAIILDRSFTRHANGEATEVSAEDGIDFALYAKAIEGDVRAQRRILAMIRKREQWLEKRRPRSSRGMNFTVKVEPVGKVGLLRAALLLDIAELNDEEFRRSGARYHHFKTWAMQAAISRPGSKTIKNDDISLIKCFTRQSETLRWPRGLSHA